MRVLKTILLVTTVGALFAGQTGKIAGRVTDAQTGADLVGCNVVATGTTFGAATDANGEYFILNLPPGAYALKFSLIGYADYTASGVRVSIDVTTPVNASLSSRAVQLAGVSVTAERPVIENTLTSTKQIIDGSLAATLPVATVEELVKTLPGITEEGGEIHLRGGRTGEEMFLVDGASVVNPIMGGEAVPVNPATIRELQVITGTFNAEYGQAMSGLFNTVLKEAESGVHADVAYRTSLGSDYFKEEKGPFADADAYSESLTIEGQAAGSSTYSQADFGGNSTILDGNFSVGRGNTGLVASFRKYDDPGRLPGMAQDYQNIQAKLTYQLGGNLKLGAELMSFTRNSFYDPSYDPMKVAGAGGDMMAWEWKYALDQYPRTEENTNQFGLTANYVLSPTTNLTARVDLLSKTQEDGAKDASGNFITFEDPTQEITPAGGTYSGAEGPNHIQELEDETNANGWYGQMNVYGHYFSSDETHTTLSLGGTSQMTPRHLLKGGFEYRLYSIDRDGHDVWFGRTVGFTEDNPRLQSHNIGDISPWELAAYGQDQMEFNDMIVNVGFRYDAFNAGADHGVWDEKKDGTTVFEDPTINPFDPSLRRATETKSKLSPRLGISFPIGDNMAFRYAYGSFFQRPTFYDLLENYLVQMDGGTESGYFVYIGNANLDPQETTIYEMGLQYSLAGGFKVDASGYYKDIANLMSVQEVFNVAFVDSGQSGDQFGTDWAPGDPYQASHYFYKTSSHFGNVRGLELSLSKTAGTGLSGRVSYTFSIAQGTASDKLNQGTGSFSQESGAHTGNILTMTTLDWHRPHVMNGYLSYNLAFAGLLDRAGASVTFNGQSGLPQSARVGAAGAALKERAPYTFDLGLKLDAGLNLGIVKPTVFVLVDNLLNRRNVVMIADPSSYFDASPQNDYNGVAAGPRNNLMAYGVPRTIHVGFSISY